MKAAVAIICLLAFAGCAMPQWRVLQKTVPAPIAKPGPLVEAERKAADLIARKIETPVELKPVAASLSASLGAPAAPITAPKITDAAHQADDYIRKALIEQQNQLANHNKILQSLQGKEIEGTGFNLFGPSMGFMVIALIALGVAFPPLATLLFFLLKQTRNALKTTVGNIDQFSTEHPVEAAKLKDMQSRTMDTVHKRLIKKIKLSS